VTHVPLIIKEPGQIHGRTVDMLVEQVDIPASILGLADIPVPSWMEGRSLLPLIRGEGLPPRPAFSMNLESNPSLWNTIDKGSIAVWEGDYKLIHYLEKDETLLFNLKYDPDELENLFDREPATGKRLLNVLLKNLGQANEKIMQYQ
jgi:arylsulfatase A-like enzyme